MSVALKARHLVQAPLPPIRLGSYKTKSDSTHDLEFKRTLGYWSSFELEVRQSTLSQRWSPDDLAHLSAANNPSRYYLSNEQYVCGDEYSVQGRFAQNVGQVMSAVFGSLNIDSLFGDFKTCAPDSSIKGKLPDFVLATENGTLLAVGEGKTPWVHAFKNDQMAEDKLRHSFAKSPYIEVPSSHVANPKAYHNKVTLRECFLFLANKTSKDYRVEVVGGGSKYVSRRPKAHNVGVSKSHFKYISDNESIPPPTKADIPPVPSGASKSRGKSPSPKDSDQDRNRRGDHSGVTTRSQEAARKLESRTSKLSMKSRSPSPPKVPRDKDGFVPVHHDEESDTSYFITDNGAEVTITLMVNRHRELHFEFQGRDYRAKLDKGKGRRK